MQNFNAICPAVRWLFQKNSCWGGVHEPLPPPMMRVNTTRKLFTLANISVIQEILMKDGKILEFYLEDWKFWPAAASHPQPMKSSRRGVGVSR